MARTPATQTIGAPPRLRRARTLPSSFTLALWRFRTMWRLLLIAGLGSIVAVLLVCILPLFTQVALSAGIHRVLGGSGDATHIVVIGYANEPTAQTIDGVQQQLGQIISTDMGSYAISSAPQFTETLAQLQLPADSSAPNSISRGTIAITGSDMTQVATQYTIVSGRLPAVSSDDMEVALTKDDANALNAKVGSVLQTQIDIGPHPLPFDLHVVGIVIPQTTSALAPQDAQSNAQQFLPQDNYHAVASSQTLLTVVSTIAARNGIDTTANGPHMGPPQFLSWSYPLDSSHISANSLNDVIDRLNKVQSDVQGRLNGQQGLQGLFIASGANQALNVFRVEILLMQIPLLLLLLQVFALVLLFVRMMADLLVDRQAEAIATLRSRGATRRQIFNTFTLHNIALSLIALVAGPLIAIPIVRALASRALPASNAGALAVISGNPLAVAWDVRWYALAAMIVSGATMIFTTNRAASKNIITLRRENARTNAKPFWQRLNLDLIFGGLALLGYVGYIIAVSNVSAQIQLVLSPVALIASLLMMVAAALLFVRVMPPLLGLAARLATRGRGAPSMLALTQMARSPKQPTRMTLLLTLASAFTLFTLIFSASQSQRIIDVANYQTGADFLGILPSDFAAHYTFSDLEARYRQIPGVTSASLGYQTEVNPNPGGGPFVIELMAVDTDTFTQTARWSDLESAQPLSDLMAQLRTARTNAEANDNVPALLDDATWQEMELTPGARFTLNPPGYGRLSMGFIAIGHVAHLPGVYGSRQGGGLNGMGGVLADYQSFADIYHHDLTSSAAPITLSPNVVRLATRDDAASLASVRKALSSGELAVQSLRDTRQMINDARENPLQIEFANTLLIGAATAMLLALIGIWVGSWLNARGRLVNFAVLRAIGTTPRQIRSMLVWEQAIVYVAGAAIGIALGWALSLTALPMLIFVELATSGNFIRVPNVPPARVIIPTQTLTIALVTLIVICVLALLLTMAALARLSLGQTLRLNED
ncbi:MAG TPA: FtsX-like permease family protein [Ktedonobacterales bacterium]